MSGASEAGGPGPFIGKWRRHWPEWSVAEVFVPAPQRATALAWEALQYELQEAAWAGDDPRPGEAKLGWWVEELAGWSQRRRRHPLGQLLQAREAPWSGLASALPALAATRDRPLSGDEAWRGLDPVSQAVAAAEASLFGDAADPGRAGGAWLHARLARHPAGAVPLDVLAEGEADAPSRWARALAARFPASRGAPRVRRLVAALAHERLRRGDAGRPLPAWAALRSSWAAARD